MRPEERGLAMSLWAMGALFGPILGPHPYPSNLKSTH
jgi:MFS family permease